MNWFKRLFRCRLSDGEVDALARQLRVEIAAGVPSAALMATPQGQANRVFKRFFETELDELNINKEASK